MILAIAILFIFTTAALGVLLVIERTNHSDTKDMVWFANDRANRLNALLTDEQEKCKQLKQELRQFKNAECKPTETNEDQEQGNFVRTRKLQRATPETYRNMFDMDLNGQRILEHLTNVFCKDAFVSNDKGGERETCYRLGQQSVINFIILNINQANSPLYKEQDND